MNEKRLIIIGIIILMSVISYFVGSAVTYRKLDNSLNNHKVNY